MSYTYRDLLCDIKKIPEHRLDTLITTHNDSDDTYYVLSREEVVEEQEMPSINNNSPIKTESIDFFLEDEAEEPDTPKPEEREREYPWVISEDDFDDDDALEMPPDTEEEEVFILGPKEQGPTPDIELALIVNDSDKTSDAAAAALKKPEDWTANNIIAELDRLNIETKINGFSLQFNPVKKIPKYLESIIHSRKMEIICQIKENESPSPKSPAQDFEDSIDIEGLLDDGFELET